MVGTYRIEAFYIFLQNNKKVSTCEKYCSLFWGFFARPAMGIIQGQLFLGHQDKKTI